MKKFYWVLFVFLMPTQVMAENIEILEKYKDYIEILENPVENPSAQVIEFYSYNCLYCYNSEPYVKALLQNSDREFTFERFHVNASRTWELSQMAFAAARIADVEDKVHHLLFEHVQKTGGFNSIAEIKDFFAKHGLKDVIDRHFESDQAKALRKQISGYVKAYKLKAVPRFIINGKYKVSFKETLKQDEFIELVNKIIKFK